MLLPLFTQQHFFLVIFSWHKSQKMHLFLIPVSDCLRKVDGLAASVLSEFREGTHPPCSGAQTCLARQDCSTHVHAQMNAHWEVG